MSKPLYIWGAILVAAAALSSTGCEGWDRKHDNKLVDVSPPPPDADPPRMGHHEKVNIPDRVENMHAARQAYRNGAIDTSMPFDQLEARSRVNDAASRSRQRQWRPGRSRHSRAIDGCRPGLSGGRVRDAGRRL